MTIAKPQKIKITTHPPGRAKTTINCFFLITNYYCYAREDLGA